MLVLSVLLLCRRTLSRMAIQGTAESLSINNSNKNITWPGWLHRDYSSLSCTYVFSCILWYIYFRVKRSVCVEPIACLLCGFIYGILRNSKWVAAGDSKD